MPHLRPLASVSLDLDNLWSYMKTHGDAGWESRPSYLPAFLPPVLDELDRLGLKITFFVVGVDAARSENAAALRAVTERGHEVGNHSFEHEPWLHRYPRERLQREIADAEEAIVAATGQKPIGFRGPGFSWSAELFEILLDGGYLYDASTLPTFLGPLARAYYFWTARLSAEDRAERAALFGTVRDGLRPNKAYSWQLAGERTLLEIPVTTFPGIRTPFHLSYLLYLSRVSERLMLGYLRAAAAACRLTGTQPSFLLHPLDLLGGDQAPALAFFPGMDLTGERKRELFHRVLTVLGEYFTLVNMSTHARALLERSDLALRAPTGGPAARDVRVAGR
jgi:peptidoglycan/xylan/chitin deacetylase (PgdA/CDA1 family)